MTTEENNLSCSATEVTTDPAEKKMEIFSGLKKGPPVAPKPAWFRQSLRKIRCEQDQKKQGEAAKTRRAAGVHPSFNVRSASSVASLSIKDKIHSFETFSNPDSPDSVDKERHVGSSSSFRLPSHLVDRKCARNPQNMQKDQAASERLTETAASLPASSPSLESLSHPEPHPCQSLAEPPSCQTTSTHQKHGKQFSNSVSVQHSLNVQTSTELNDAQEAEIQNVDITRSVEVKAFSSPHLTSAGSSRAEGGSSREQNRAEKQREPFSLTTDANPSTDRTSYQDLEGQDFGKILAFSNQVSQALMRSLPVSSNPDLPEPTIADDIDPQECDPAQDVADAGFSVSLAALRECTMELGPSPPGAQSLISAIPSEEIEMMIREVRAMDGDTLKQLQDIHVVILHKDEGAGLGFTLAGGSDLESKALTVHKVFPSGLATQEGTIQKGDEVLSINGQTLRGVTHADATAALRQARELKLAVVVVCKRTGEEPREEGGNCEESQPAKKLKGTLMSMELEKGAGGVGFTLEGGKASIHGDRPIVINRIFKGGAAEQSGLRCGDEVLQVQGSSLRDMTRFEAWHIIKALPDGRVAVDIRRRDGKAQHC